MKNKMKKILTTTIISAVSATAIGCSSGNSKLASNITKGVSDFVSSINNLDYVETNATTTNQSQTQTNQNTANYLSESISSNQIENTITHPNARTDNFKLFVLSESPFVSFTSDDNSASFNLAVKFSTNKIEETSDEIDSKINSLILKRSVLMIYVNEIYAGNVSISEENRTAINAYVNVIKENASFLKGNRGMVKNQLGLASDLLSTESNDNLINYYIIKSGEALETRSNKIDSTLSAISSIIEILENNLTSNSPYYGSKLSSSYESLLNGTNANQTTISSENKELADNIANSLNMNISKTEQTSENQATENTQTQQITNEQQTRNAQSSQTNEPAYNIKNLNINTPNSQNLKINNISNGTSTQDIISNHQSKNNQNTSQTTPQSVYPEQYNRTNTQTNSPSSRRARRIQARRDRMNNYQNNTQNQPIMNTSDNSTNRAKSVDNMNNQNIRAERTGTSIQTEEVISSRQNFNNSERAERMPYNKGTKTFNAN